MKFFKHFTDAHEGTTITTLFERLGHMGPSCYWTLVELCAKKLEKEEDEEYTEAHCHFRFHESVLRKKLRISSKNLQKFLGICSELSQVFSTFSADIIEIEFPKLLESLDRDARRARPERGQAAPKRKNKRKNNTQDSFSNFDWKESAQLVMKCIVKYSDWSESEAEVRAEIGDVLFEIARRAGTHKMRMLPANPFTINLVMGMLKDTNSQLQLKGATA